MDGGRHCKVQAALLRDSLNTITVDLRAELVMVNATPLTFDLVEPTLKSEEEAKESSFKLGPSTCQPVCKNEVIGMQPPFVVRKEGLILNYCTLCRLC